MEYTIRLNGLWELRRTDEDTKLNAEVPGSVMGTYIRAGLIPDPNYGENEASVKKIFDFDYEYSTDFTLDSKLLAYDRAELVFEGLDTLAEVELNGKHVLCADNMHRTYVIDVKSTLREGRNLLKVVLRSAAEYIAKAIAKADVNFPAGGCMPGNNYLRKAHCMFGWDWGPQLPDMGIWKDVYLTFGSGPRLISVYPVQKHLYNSVSLTLDCETECTCGAECTLEATVTAPDGKQYSVSDAVRDRHTCIKLDVDAPKLWWPNGLGAQPLYDLNVRLISNGYLHGEIKQRIGLRTVTVSTETDADGNGAEFAFVVNGVKFFSTGANYIPEDTVLSRITPYRTRKLVRDCARANFNTIRVWGGGYYPSDAFFDACDEYGILVWEDLMFACNVYEFDRHFEENTKREVIDNVKRIRHHASLALWCGNNEIEQGWQEWYPALTPSRMRYTDYFIMFEYFFKRIIEDYDPQTFYWPSSPSSGGKMLPGRQHLDEYRVNADNIGDAHYYDVWLRRAPFTEYRNHLIRYCSEFAFQSIPSIKTMNTVIGENDKNLFSPVMESHQKNSLGNGLIMHYIAETYRNPKDFESLIYVSQLMQAYAISYGVEHWRRNRPYCMGALFWQLNDIWPGISWSTIDYYGRWKAMHYACKHIFAPFTASILDEGFRMRVYIHNETRSMKQYRVYAYCIKMNNVLLWENQISGNAEPLSVGVAIDCDFSDICAGLERECCFGYRLYDEAGFVFEDTAFFVKPKQLSLLPADISANVSETDDAFEITLSGNVFAYKVMLDLETDDAVFEDNYFPLTGSIRKIRAMKCDLSRQMTLTEFTAQLTVRSLSDTY